MHLKEDLKNYSWLALGTITSAAFALIFQLLVARQLAPYQLGLFAAGLTSFALLAPIAGLGIHHAWLKLYAQEGQQANRWILPSYWLALLASLASAFLLASWAFIGPYYGNERWIFIFLSAALLTLPIQELVSAHLQLTNRFRLLAAWQLLPNTFRLLFLALFLLLGYQQPHQLVLTFTLTSLLLLPIGLIGLPKKAPRRSKPKAQDLVHHSWPYALGGLFYLIYYQSDILLLQLLDSNQAAGHYQVAFILLSGLYLFPAILYQKLLLPRIHRWANHNPNHLAHSYRLGNRSMLLLGCVAGAGMWLIAPYILPLLFGSSYHTSIPLLQLLSLAIPLRFMATSSGSVLFTGELMRRKVKIMGAVAVFNLLLNLLLIPYWSIFGAAVATLFSDLLLLVLYRLSAGKYLKECQPNAPVTNRCHRA